MAEPVSTFRATKDPLPPPPPPGPVAQQWRAIEVLDELARDWREAHDHAERMLHEIGRKRAKALLRLADLLDDQK